MGSLQASATRKSTSMNTPTSRRHQRRRASVRQSRITGVAREARPANTANQPRALPCTGPANHRDTKGSALGWLVSVAKLLKTAHLQGALSVYCDAALAI